MMKNLFPMKLLSALALASMMSGAQASDSPKAASTTSANATIKSSANVKQATSADLKNANKSSVAIVSTQTTAPSPEDTAGKDPVCFSTQTECALAIEKPVAFEAIAEIDTEVPHDLYDPVMLVHALMTRKACSTGQYSYSVRTKSLVSTPATDSVAKMVVKNMGQEVSFDLKNCQLNGIGMPKREKSVTGKVTVHYLFEKDKGTKTNKALDLSANFAQLEITERNGGVRYEGKMEIKNKYYDPKAGRPQKNFKSEIVGSGQHKGDIPGAGLSYEINTKEFEVVPYLK